MAVTNKVREFFTDRINAELAKRTEKIKESMDEVLIETSIISIVEGRFGINIKDAISQVEYLNKKQEELKDQENEILDTLSNIIKKLGYGSSYRFEAHNNIIPAAKKAFEDKVIEQLYPDKHDALEQLDKARQDVYGAVLLATTEQKLITALTNLLESYGGDLGDLKKVVGL